MIAPSKERRPLSAAEALQEAGSSASHPSARLLPPGIGRVQALGPCCISPPLTHVLCHSREPLYRLKGSLEDAAAEGVGG